ncbi:peptidyl-prolyl cis-trans isomerase [Lachnospiraceae bacterium]|jgi:hypothetical protein|nr:peptidyl-prolyl cis-trans isomerase [uncultured Schaedlerella sp.]MCI9154095.1 peptidyl-prolyl cis-trans isomerase [Ruminococcus sp.]NBI61240.1 peptidyl-prolyl cis-trans isomerase [Lachnospiraceae bacterium]
MKLLKKRCVAAAAAGTLAAALLMGCGSSVDDNEVVGTVGESEISFGVANFYLRMVQSRYEAYYTTLTGDTPAEFWLQDWDGGTYQESIKKNLVEKLEDLYLIRQHAQEYDVALTEEEEKAIAKAAADFEEDNSLEAKELVSGHTEYIQEYLELATIQEKMDEPMKAGVDEDISDEDAAQKSMKYVYFPYVKEDDENSEAISDEEKKELKTKAEKFAKDLQESEEKDIDAAAKEADLEVETVTFDSDTKAPNADFMKAADKLKENEVTDAVESDDGLYVGIVTSLLDREATDTKKEQIIEERKTEQYNSLLKKWREETEISFNEERWQEIDFAYVGVAIPKKEDDAKADNDKKEDSAAEKDADIEEPGKDSGTEEE